MSEFQDIEAEAVAGATLGIAAAAVEAFDHSAPGQFAVVPDGFKVESLEQFQVAPNRMQAKLAVAGAPGFIGYVNRWGGEGTLITVNRTARSISATLDHGDGESPQFRDHSITLTSRISPELTEWLTISKKPLGQRTLAEFLEDHATEVSRPDAAAIMDMVLTFEATKKVSFKSGVRLQNGDRQLTYSEETQGNGTSGTVMIPERITVVAPIFDGGDTEPVDFVLRYSIEEGALTFRLHMHQQEVRLREAFGRIVDEVDSHLGEGIPRPFLES